MTDEIEYEEIGSDAHLDEFGELEIEVIAARHQADCQNHSGCAGCSLLPILILIIIVIGSIPFII